MIHFCTQAVASLYLYVALYQDTGLLEPGLHLLFAQLGFARRPGHRSQAEGGSMDSQGNAGFGIWDVDSNLGGEDRLARLVS